MVTFTHAITKTPYMFLPEDIDSEARCKGVLIMEGEGPGHKKGTHCFVQSRVEMTRDRRVRGTRDDR